MTELRRMLSALHFLTVLPVPDPGWEEGRMARAAAWFPLAGLVAGLAGGAVWLVAGPGWLGAGLALAAMVALTGALHEDGLADCADGLGGRDREKRLAIMDDSRIGAYGVLALIFSIGLRWAALAALPGWAGAKALVIAAVAGRAAMVPVSASLPYARAEGLGRLTEGAGARECAIALGLAGAVALTGGAEGLLALALGGVAAAAVAVALRARIGGYTGDGLGAVCQLAEIAALLTLSAFWGGT